MQPSSISGRFGLGRRAVLRVPPRVNPPVPLSWPNRVPACDQDGVLKNKETYEIMDAELVGLHQDTSLVLGKHSGRHAFRSRLQVRTYVIFLPPRSRSPRWSRWFARNHLATRARVEISARVGFISLSHLVVERGRTRKASWGNKIRLLGGVDERRCFGGCASTACDRST